MRRERGLVSRRHDRARGLNHLPSRHLELGSDDPLMTAFDPRRAATHELGGPQTRQNDKLERAELGWSVNHRPSHFMLW